MFKTYSELMSLKTFEERFQYVCLDGVIGRETFGWDRYLNQQFYNGVIWKSARKRIIVRDDGLDLGCEDHPIFGIVIVHHLNPVTKEQLLNEDPFLIDPENLISVSDLTHKAITYNDPNILPSPYVERKMFDTCPWKSGGENQNG